MSAKMVPVSSTSSIGNTFSKGKQSSRANLKQEGPAPRPEAPWRKDNAELPTEAAMQALRESREERGREKELTKSAHTWEELLGESNDRIRWGAVQVKRIYTTEVPTPDILGKTLKEAVSILKASGLSITKICQEYSHDATVGRIMVQMPSPGIGATRKMGIAVVVSKGPMPDQEFDFWNYNAAASRLPGPSFPEDEAAGPKIGIEA